MRPLLMLACLLSSLPLQLHAADPSPRDPRILRVMTYNIHAGWGKDGFSLKRIAKVITDAHVDVAVIQEVDVGVLGFSNQASELGRLTGLHWKYATTAATFGRHQGHAILSRRKIQKFDHYELTSESTGPPPQFAMIGQIGLPKPLPDLFLVGTQLDLGRGNSGQRLAQAKGASRVACRASTDARPRRDPRRQFEFDAGGQRRDIS